MPFTTIKSWLRDSSVRSSKKARLKLDRFDDRINPSASLFDLDSSFLGAANQPSTILGASDDGRYVIFESKATNLVVAQSDIPDTNDLFWRDLQTGDTRMVTALPLISDIGYDYQATALSPQSFALQAVVDGPPVLPSFKQAVISGDGQFVAFTTVVNASRLDEDFANAKYAPTFTADTTVYDLGNTLDAFRWQARGGRLQLASRTDANPDTQDNILAFGRYGSVESPAISSDGTYVGFVSAVDAWYTNELGRPTDVTDGVILDGGNTKDVFVASLDENTTPTVRVLSSVPIQVVLPDLTQIPPPTFTFNVFRTYGHMAGGDGVSVDPNGHYLSVGSNGALSVAGVASVNPSRNPNFGVVGDKTDLQGLITDSVGSMRVVTGTAALSEAYRWNIQAGLIGDTSANLLTQTGLIGGNFTGVTTNGGNAQNVAIASRNSNSMIISTSTSGGGNGTFTPSPLAPNATRQDIYYVVYDTAPTAKVLNSQRIPSIATSTTTADTTQYSITPNGKFVVYTQVEGLQADGVTEKYQAYYRQVLPSVGAAQRITVGLDGQPLTTGGSSPRVSQNGRFVTFLSSTKANLIDSPALTDTNGVNDAFLRDMFASVNSKGQFIPKTSLISINSAGTGTANGVASRVFLGTTFEDPQNGITPSTTLDSLGRVVFNDTATNIDAGFVPTHGGTSSYQQTLPIGGVPPTVPPTDAPRTAVVSGGTAAGINLLNFTGTGTVVLGQRFTPFPGFTGELRVAQADVNGDGFLDTIIGAGPGGGPRVVIYSGANDQKIYDQFVYESTFRGGVNVAAGLINGDTSAELVVGADDGGGARVRVLDIANGTTMADFFAYEPSFRGGVRVATGDFNGDGVIDVMTGAGTGGGPRVSVFNGVNLATNGTLVRFIDFFAMELNLRNGVTVAGGDMNNDGVDDIITGAGNGGAPRVTVFESKSVATRPLAPDRLYDFFAGNITSRAGIRVGVKNVDGDDVADIVTGEGFGRESRIRTFAGGKFSSALTPTEINNTFVVFNDLMSLNGAWVG